MNPTRDQLLGYLLDALDSDERESLEKEILARPELERELESLQESILPLKADAAPYEPPVGLARRTCAFVARRAAAISREVQLAPTLARPSGRWSLADMVVAAGLMLAAGMLFFPAVNHSRYSAQLAGCQNNLRELGLGLTRYSENHDGYFPAVPADGPLAAAGVYAPTLVDAKLVGDHNRFVCPGAGAPRTTADTQPAKPFRVPTLQELQDASEGQLAEWKRLMGGNYGYNFGYLANGKPMPTKNLHRPTFAILGDATSMNRPGQQSENHGGLGQNVLMEAGNVKYLTCPESEGCHDNVYQNDQGQIAAGVNRHDAVLGSSATRPILWPVNSGSTSQPLPLREVGR